VVDSLRGKLLVAAPSLADPNFYRTVVFMLDHNDEGAAGLVLNRPSDTELRDALPDWAHVAAEPGSVFVGGPVQQNAIICLGRVVPNAAPEGFVELAHGIGSVDLEQDAALVVSDIAELRVFAGYAGWGAGQLEGELDEDAWLVLESLPGDVFAPEPQHLWREVFRRQTGNLRLLANFPPHPSLN
jgi:putative transcriptional regulator